MSAGVILINRFVADYCNYSNRRQVKTAPDYGFLLSALQRAVIFSQYLNNRVLRN
jgi:hypothetical protein